MNLTVLEKGRYITTRTDYAQRINLYFTDSKFFEVIYEPNENVIKDVLEIDLERATNVMNGY
ncbi:MAG: hypothetical protein R2813_11280 [Flavobacteriales bacterium]